MKRQFLFIAIFTIASYFQSHAQVFTKDKRMINVGIGLVGTHVARGKPAIPQINAAVELGKWDVGKVGVVSIGGYGSYRGYSFKYAPGAKDTWGISSLGVRSAFHYTKLKNKKFDAYAGLMLGYAIFSAKSRSGNKYGSSSFYFPIFLGGRYMFKKNLGVFAEIGGGKGETAALKGGATFYF